jgi:hypothetical protein
MRACETTLPRASHVAIRHRIRAPSDQIEKVRRRSVCSPAASVADSDVHLWRVSFSVIFVDWSILVSVEVICSKFGLRLGGYRISLVERIDVVVCERPAG